MRLHNTERMLIQLETTIRISVKKNQWRTFPAIVDRLRYGVYCRLNRIIKAFITCIKLSGEFILRLSKSLASGIAMPGGVSGNLDSITFHDDPKV